jgi:hypothetical protein
MIGDKLLERVPCLEDEEMYESSIVCRHEIPARLLQHTPEPFAGMMEPHPTTVTDCVGVTRADIVVTDRLLRDGVGELLMSVRSSELFQAHRSIADIHIQGL